MAFQRRFYCASVLLLSTVLAFNVAQAADVFVEDAATGGIYGSLTFGSFIDITAANGGGTVSEPSVFANGKFAYDSTTSPWGWQVDTRIDYADSNWIRPSIDDVEFQTLDAGGRVHLTYRASAATKLGVFGGYSQEHEETVGKNGVPFTYYGIAGTTKGETKRGLGSLGFEAMHHLDDTTWLQSSVTLIDPLYASIRVSDGTTVVEESENDILGKSYGGALSASLHRDFTDNFNGLAFGKILHLKSSNNSDVTGFSGGLGAKYAMDAVPLEIFVQGQYSITTSDDETDDSLTASSGVIWRFGTPSHGINRKLF
jgi:hypothetical protein